MKVLSANSAQNCAAKQRIGHRRDFSGGGLFDMFRQKNIVAFDE